MIKRSKAKGHCSFTRTAFINDRKLFRLLVNRIPDDEIANFQPALYLREAFRFSVEPEKFSNVADSLSYLKDRGVDLNTPSIVTVIDDEGKRAETFTLGQLVVMFGHRRRHIAGGAGR
jgi:hypothetical protein